MAFGIDQILEARQRIDQYVITTPLVRLQKLDAILGCQVYVKLENLQNAGSFKLRGALNAALALEPDQLKSGIVTASTGNHGRACALAGQMLGVPVTVVVPHGAPEIKVQNIAALGAEIQQCPAVERFDVAARISAETGATFIAPYDDPYVMAGQGTCGLEIAEQLPDVDVVVVPTSGGGLLSGVTAALKSRIPDVTVVAAEPGVMARWRASLLEGQAVTLPQAQTVADALLSNHPGYQCFDAVKDLVDEAVPVADQDILRAQKLLLTEGCIFAEPSSCIGIAAVLSGVCKVEKDQKVCFIISGGNCSIKQLEPLNDIEL